MPGSAAPGVLLPAARTTHRCCRRARPPPQRACRQQHAPACARDRHGCLQALCACT
jgi:hypothetical protein